MKYNGQLYKAVDGEESKLKAVKEAKSKIERLCGNTSKLQSGEDVERYMQNEKDKVKNLAQNFLRKAQVRFIGSKGDTLLVSGYYDFKDGDGARSVYILAELKARDGRLSVSSFKFK